MFYLCGSIYVTPKDNSNRVGCCIFYGATVFTINQEVDFISLVSLLLSFSAAFCCQLVCLKSKLFIRSCFMAVINTCPKEIAQPDDEFWSLSMAMTMFYIPQHFGIAIHNLYGFVPKNSSVLHWIFFLHFFYLIFKRSTSFIFRTRIPITNSRVNKRKIKNKNKTHKRNERTNELNGSPTKGICRSDKLECSYNVLRPYELRIACSGELKICIQTSLREELRINNFECILFNNASWTLRLKSTVNSFDFCFGKTGWPT